MEMIAQSAGGGREQDDGENYCRREGRGKQRPYEARREILRYAQNDNKK
jgi:hypothetical protein